MCSVYNLYFLPMCDSFPAIREMFTYHITHKDTGSQKLLHVQSKDSIVDEIEKLFDADGFILQYLTTVDGLGEVWIDTDAPGELPDSCKLMIISRGPSPLSSPLTSSPSTLSPSTTSTITSPATQPVQPESCTVVETQPNHRCHLTFYRLPKFPRDIQVRLDAQDSQVIVDRSCRAKIIRVLHADLLEKSGWYVYVFVLLFVCLPLVLQLNLQCFDTVGWSSGTTFCM